MSELGELAYDVWRVPDDPSGALQARAAHDAGAVVPPLELPTFRGSLSCVFRCSSSEAREVLEALAGRLLDHPLVVEVAWSVSE